MIKVPRIFRVRKPQRYGKIRPSFFARADLRALFLRFDDVVTCIEKEDGSELARLVEPVLIKRDMVRHFPCHQLGRLCSPPFDLELVSQRSLVLELVRHCRPHFEQVRVEVEDLARLP